MTEIRRKAYVSTTWFCVNQMSRSVDGDLGPAVPPGPGVATGDGANEGPSHFPQHVACGSLDRGHDRSDPGRDLRAAHLSPNDRTPGPRDRLSLGRSHR